MSYTNISDKSVRSLGVWDAYVLNLVARNCLLSSGKFSAGIENQARKLKLNHNTLRSALHRLRAKGYIADLTPDRRNKPHDYIPTPKGLELVSKNWRPKIGDQELDTKNWSPIIRDEEYSVLNTATTTHLNKSSSSTRQQVLIENDNAQNLGALDIEAQRSLAALGIRADLKQSFRSAPDLAQKHTPAEILMFHDDGTIAGNLARWREAWDAGADVRDKPALIWAKIIEGQAPPDAAKADEVQMSDWLQEVIVT